MSIFSTVFGFVPLKAGGVRSRPSPMDVEAWLDRHGLDLSSDSVEIHSALIEDLNAVQAGLLVRSLHRILSCKDPRAVKRVLDRIDAMGSGIDATGVEQAAAGLVGDEEADLWLSHSRESVRLLVRATAFVATGGWKPSAFGWVARIDPKAHEVVVAAFEPGSQPTGALAAVSQMEAEDANEGPLAAPRLEEALRVVTERIACLR